MGGPSILENGFNLGMVDKDRYTVFLEAKSLTTRFLNFNLKPDFYLAFFPEKCQTNSFQHVILQSFLADIDLTGLLKPEYAEEYCYFKSNFNDYFEVYLPHRGPHKRYRWKPEIKLKNSPFDLFSKISGTAVITHLRSKKALDGFKNDLFYYDDKYSDGDFSLERYYQPLEEDGCLVLNSFNHLNSAAIALLPLEAYMGFEKIYFVGMDMSMMGSMEYSSLYTFRSIRHFARFFKKAISVFSPCFKENKKKFMRPPYEFEDMEKIMRYGKIEFTNVFEPFEFAQPIPGIRNITFKEFLNE